jgi:antitoxin component YwqK of YwqJK toxin-antitoxin module
MILSLLFLACSKEKRSVAHGQGGAFLQSEEISLEGLRREGVDLNGDGKDDQITYYENDVKRLVTRDINFDGVVDMLEYYENGVLIREESDLDFDAKLDLVVHYKDGKIESKEYSVDFMGTVHGRQIYNAQGQLIRAERDTDGDGNMDEFEFYKPGQSEPYKVERKGDSIESVPSQ